VRFVRLGTLILLASLASGADAQQRRTRNVVLVVTDGLRWQELFGGAERALISAKPGGVEDTTALLRDFWRDDAESRRAALLPFMWSTIAKQGQIWGNQAKGSVASVTNGLNFSYPGYNELLTGAADPRIDSNGYPPNPNVTVFEWLAAKPAYRGKVAAFATWAAFRRIFNRDRAGFIVQDGWDPPFAKLPRTPRRAVIDSIYRTMVQLWPENSFDAPMHMAMAEHLRAAKPRVLFVGYGETDEWAHSGRYDLLLRSARQVDAFIADLWRTMQSMPEYRGTTTFIITTDHGRGDGPAAWRDHGARVAGAQNIWLAVIGPDTPPLGERANVEPITQSQIAATLAALLGERWQSTNPNAGAPIAEAVAPRR
jgi:hypothetical protein